MESVVSVTLDYVNVGIVGIGEQTLEFCSDMYTPVADAYKEQPLMSRTTRVLGFRGVVAPWMSHQLIRVA